MNNHVYGANYFFGDIVGRGSVFKMTKLTVIVYASSTPALPRNTRVSSFAEQEISFSWPWNLKTYRHLHIYLPIWPTDITGIWMQRRIIL